VATERCKRRTRESEGITEGITGEDDKIADVSKETSP